MKQFGFDLIDVPPENNFWKLPMLDLLEKIKENEKLQIAIAAGCEIITKQKEVQSKDGSMSMSVIVKTKYPVNIKLSEDGRLQVYELRSKNQIVQKL